MDKQTADNLATARSAWAHMIDRKPKVNRNAGELRSFLDACTDDVIWEASFPEDTPLYGGTTVYSPRRSSSSGQLRGKKAVAALGEGELRYMETGGLNTPPEFIASGDRVVMLGEASYTIKKGNVVIENHKFAVVMDFRDGLISRLRLYEDVSDWNEAYRYKSLEQ